MSNDAVSQAEDTVSRADFANLQEQLRIAKAERDRQIFEKSEIVTKANTYAKERDELKEQLASVLSERDRIIGDVVADHDKIVADLTSERDRLAEERASLSARVQDATRLAEAAGRRADEAAAEISRLRHAIETAPSNEPVDVIWKLVKDKTKAALDFVRGIIPADSPILPWYDKTIDTIAQIGFVLATFAKEFLRWATPKALELFNWGKREVEARLAKKSG